IEGLRVAARGDGRRQIVRQRPDLLGGERDPAHQAGEAAPGRVARGLILGRPGPAVSEGLALQGVEEHPEVVLEDGPLERILHQRVAAPLEEPVEHGQERSGERPLVEADRPEERIGFQARRNLLAARGGAPREERAVKLVPGMLGIGVVGALGGQERRKEQDHAPILSRQYQFALSTTLRSSSPRTKRATLSRSSARWRSAIWTEAAAT